MKGGKERESDRVRSEKCVKEEKCECVSVCEVMEGFVETENVTSRLILWKGLVSTGLKHLQVLRLWQPHTSHRNMENNTVNYALSLANGVF